MQHMHMVKAGRMSIVVRSRFDLSLDARRHAASVFLLCLEGRSCVHRARAGGLRELHPRVVRLRTPGLCTNTRTRVDLAMHVLGRDLGEQGVQRLGGHGQASAHASQGSSDLPKCP